MYDFLRKNEEYIRYMIKKLNFQIKCKNLDVIELMQNCPPNAKYFHR